MLVVLLAYVRIATSSSHGLGKGEDTLPIIVSSCPGTEVMVDSERRHALAALAEMGVCPRFGICFGFRMKIGPISLNSG